MTDCTNTVESHSLLGRNHLILFARHWNELKAYLNAATIVIDGESLSLAAVVAISSYDAASRLAENDAVQQKVRKGFQYLMSEINAGKTIYGVNTGFGGSADLRTQHTDQLQPALMQLLNVGILSPADRRIPSDYDSNMQFGPMRPNSLPDPIVRGMMLVRCNSLIRGHSGVEMDVIQGIHKLLESNATPVVPLRGSISASGDLIPLSYIASALAGNPDISVRMRSEGLEVVMTADRALKRLNLEPIRLQAKSGLAIANGTGTSAAAASLALFQSHQIAIWAQLLSAMMSEATVGSTSNFAPFISQARPHPGQIEVSRNLTTFLMHSQLTMEKAKTKRALAQDRYPLRTAPQWIGPILERLALADQQISIELNSTTDNPLIDAEAQVIFNGGNFQAASVTSAMELSSSSMQMLGRIIYAQCSELLNHSLTPDLPPNLSADDPSKSLPMKGIDISMSAYMAELAQLTHPVSNHIQSAEMHNQAINSMALVASRITLESIDVLYLMLSSYIYVLCQALDLRCLQLEYLATVQPLIEALVQRNFGSCICTDRLPEVACQIWEAIEASWLGLSDKDLECRCTLAVAKATGSMLEILVSNSARQDCITLEAIKVFRMQASDILLVQYEKARANFFSEPSTANYLGTTSRSIYQFVRGDLGITTHKGVVDHPTIQALNGSQNGASMTIGSHTSKIYCALRQELFFDRVMGSAFKHIV